ncbi:hypothetical protein BHM03_00022875, partial [Ensete ventricosum]
ASLATSFHGTFPAHTIKPVSGKETMEMAARKQGKTNFAVTCSLLSRYIKEKGSIAELGIGMGQRSEYAAKGESLMGFRRES